MYHVASIVSLRRSSSHEPATVQTSKEHASEHRHEVSHIHCHDSYHAE